MSTNPTTPARNGDVMVPYGLLVRIITHNIRFATTTPKPGEELWSVRAPYIVNELRFNTPQPESFICLQEVLHNQLTDVLSGLNSGVVSPWDSANQVADGNYTWDYIGVGRNNGKQAGEYSPIFYRPAVWKLEYSATYWLSPTPKEPSKGWDAAQKRIWVVGQFLHHKTSRRVLIVNTHWDDQGATSRLESAKLISTFLQNYNTKAPDVPLVLTGDFNSDPSMPPYLYLKNGTLLQDMYDKVLPQRRYGNFYTTTGFQNRPKARSRIDYVFVGPHDGGDFDKNGALGYGVLSNQFDDGVYNSDHRAVVAELNL